MPKFAVTFKERDNSLFDAGQNLGHQRQQRRTTRSARATPSRSGGILEAFNTRYKTTGITVQADNEPQANDVPGCGGRRQRPADHRPLGPGRLGRPALPGRRERRHRRHRHLRHDPQRARPEVRLHRGLPARHPGHAMHLYYPLRDANGDVVTTPTARSSVVMDPRRASPLKVAGPTPPRPGNQPTGCTARMQDDPLVTGKDQQALPPFGNDAYQCVEAPMTGWQAVPSDKTAGQLRPDRQRQLRLRAT